MPGFAMERTNATNRASDFDIECETDSAEPHKKSHSNGLTKRQRSPTHEQPRQRDGPTVSLDGLPPELAHITIGFFPFSQLISRVTQQTWNTLNELLVDLGSAHATQDNAPAQLALAKNTMGGRGRADQAAEDTLKKIRILDFAQSRRAEFIKLLVLSQWGRQASEVSRLIDIHAFVRHRYTSYAIALQRIGDMKHDLVGAQFANPDLEIALDVLSGEENGTSSTLKFFSPDVLTPNAMLATLRRINKLINMRLTLFEHVPNIFSNYLVHDGRVTFTVPTEFEIDLSVAFEAHTAQFFLVDIRFLFSPSSNPKKRLRTLLDQKVNTTLMNSGLIGCFNLLHNIVLTHKITILFRQAVELARNSWAENLRVELLRRTLVVQYWTKQAGKKSWIEIGVRKGSSYDTPGNTSDSSLHVRWMRDNQEVDGSKIQFNLESLNMESILLSVISLHITHILRLAFDSVRESRLYRLGELYIGMYGSSRSPGYLQMQLTQANHLKVMMDAISGNVVLRIVPLTLSRYDSDLKSDKGVADSLVGRVSRIRCLTALEEVERQAKIVGWMPFNMRRIHPEHLRRVFSLQALRSMLLFRHKSWELPLLIAFTSTMDGDTWWIVSLHVQHASTVPSHTELLELASAKAISGWFSTSSRPLNNAHFQNLATALSGMIMLQSSVDFLDSFDGIRYFPAAKNLAIQPYLRVPSMYLRFGDGAFRSHLYLTTMSPKRSPIGETFRISFKGIEQHSGYAIMVIFGQLKTAAADMAKLYANMPGDVTFQPGGRRFAIMLRVPVGAPIILSFLEKLQEISDTVATIELMKDQGFDSFSLGPSRLNFIYPDDKELRGSIKFSYERNNAQHLPEKTSTLASLMRRPQMGIDFNIRNPHYRIRESLSATLNLNQGGLRLTTELLTLTLPVLRALEKICSESGENNPRCFWTQFAARSAKQYQIRYPYLRYHFYLSVNQRRGHVIWILQNCTPTVVKSDHTALELRLKDKIYTCQGTGWRGINQGGIAHAENACDLIFNIHYLIKAYISQISQTSLRDSPKLNSAADNQPEKSISNAKPHIPQPQTSSQRNNVITID
ncbi:mediator complex subunit [Ophidiomyces ophidiicola]|nr:mediator complex subunit [Ophidiomyces ophidiicola]